MKRSPPRAGETSAGVPGLESTPKDEDELKRDET